MTTKAETTKREVIRKAYGEHWDLHKDNVDEFGWSYLGNNSRLLNNYDCSLVGEWLQKGYDSFKTGENSHIQQVYVRPKSLQGIENNNGWFSIEEHGLPKPGEYRVISHNYDKPQIEEYNGKMWYDKISGTFSPCLVTHYKPIEQEKLPLY